MPDLDQTTRRQLREALQCVTDDAGDLDCACDFWACKGPRAPMQSCITCRTCRAIQLLARACKRLGIEA